MSSKIPSILAVLPIPVKWFLKFQKVVDKNKTPELLFTHRSETDVTDVTNVTTERVWTRKQLWQEACNRAGYLIPPTTLRDWIVKACKLTYKDEYDDNEASWLLEEWIPFQRNYTKKSTRKIKDFHEYIAEKINGRSNTGSNQ